MIGASIRLSQSVDMTTPSPRIKPVYYKLVIVASSPTTEIWLGDDGGHLVQKEVGKLRTSLLPGQYVVAFGLRAPTYPVNLTKVSHFTQGQLEAGPTCPRPVPQLAKSSTRPTNKVRSCEATI